MLGSFQNKQATEVLTTPAMALTTATYREVVMAAENPTRGSRSRGNNNNWKGGRTTTEHGYVLIRVGVGHPLADVRGYAYEHRLKVWQAGHDIEGKHVHHDDHVRQNNVTSNLIPLTPAEHRAEHRKPGSNKRLPNEPNPTISCACGCGHLFLKYDTSNRPRKYVSGHNRQGSPTVDALICLVRSGVTTTSGLIKAMGLTKQAVKVCLSKLGKRGVLEHVKYGEWRLSDGRKFEN